MGVGGCCARIELRSGQRHVALARVFADLNLGKLRFCQRQRHMLAGRDHVELAWKQHDEPAGIVNPIGDASGIIAGPPVQIGPRRPHDRRPGILRDHQAGKAGNRFCAIKRQVGLDEERRPIFMQPVNGNGPPSVNGTPCAPTGSPSFDRPVTRKNT